MGVVYRALEENLGREVALKVIAPLYAHDPEFRERFTREARAQASLESAHVVAVYAHGEEDGHLYIASQLVPGGDLRQLIRASGTPSLVEALEIIEQVASGLADAHAAGLVHRDIKPGNVLVRRRPGALRAYLADFGIARRMDAAATRLTSSTAGTPSYMAPELHAGAGASPSTDIYALGCVLWVALTGSQPYPRRADHEVVAAHGHDPVPQLAGDSAMVHATNRILRTAMAKQPGQRYASATEMGADLQAALRLPVTPGTAVPEGRGGTVVRPVDRPSPTPSPSPSPVAPPAGTPTPPPAPVAFAARPAGRRTGRRWAIGGTAAALALAVGVGIALATGGSTAPPEDGFADLPPKDVLRASDKDMAVVETARIRGQFADRDGDTLTVDVTATTRGDCTGTMTSKASGGTAEIRRVADQVYLRADREYWNATGDSGTTTIILAVLGDKWVLENSLRDSTESFCDLDELLERDGRENAEAERVGTGRVGGEETVRIEQSEGGQSEVLDVRVAEPHYLMRIEESATDHFEFADFDADVTIEKPADGQVFPLRKYLEQIEKGLGALPGAEPSD